MPCLENKAEEEVDRLNTLLAKAKELKLVDAAKFLRAKRCEQQNGGLEDVEATQFDSAECRTIEYKGNPRFIRYKLSVLSCEKKSSALHPITQDQVKALLTRFDEFIDLIDNIERLRSELRLLQLLKIISSSNLPSIQQLHEMTGLPEEYFVQDETSDLLSSVVNL